jgi:hypothetical protein
MHACLYFILVLGETPVEDYPDGESEMEFSVCINCHYSVLHNIPLNDFILFKLLHTSPHRLTQSTYLASHQAHSPTQDYSWHALRYMGKKLQM